MDGWNEARARVLVACCVDDAFAKWSILVPECMVVKPGKNADGVLNMWFPFVQPGRVA